VRERLELFLKPQRFNQRYWLLPLLLWCQPVFAFAPPSEQDAYGIGMGNAVAAIAGGTHAVEWNPAGVARATVPMAQMGLGFDPATMDLLINTTFLYPFQDGTVFALSQFSEFPKAPYSNTTYIGTVAMPLNSSRDFFLGLNLKYLTLSTFTGGGVVNGQGFGMDLGLSYDLRSPQGTLASFALAIKDLNTEIRFANSYDQSVTRTFVLGAAYQNIPDTRLEMDYAITDRTLDNSGEKNRLSLGGEHFFENRFYSLRMGYDGLLNGDGAFSVGAGYHPAQPFEVTYAFRVTPNNTQFSHFLSLVYRFDQPAKNEAPTAVRPASASSEINIGSVNELTEAPSATGKPVSSIPLQKMVIQPEPAVFSPAGRQKSTTISFPGDRSANVARWFVTIQSPDQKIVRRLGGTGPITPSFVWDGLNEAGQPVREGSYKIVLKTFGTKNDLLSDDFETVEVLLPRSHFEIQAGGSYFSTHGGKKGRGEVPFTVNAGGSEQVQTWDFEISDAASNKVVFEKQGKNRLPKNIKWDGKDLNGDPAPDGAYLCLLVAQDKAGNALKTDSIKINISNNPPELAFKAETPWADFAARKDFKFSLNAADRVGIQNWKLVLSDENNRVLKNFEGEGAPPKEAVWDGTLSDGKAALPGSLVKAVFSVRDKAENSATAEPVLVQVDYHPPSGQEQLTLNLTTVYFNLLSPDLTESAKKEIEKAAGSIKPYLNKSVLVVKGYTSPTETGDLITLSHNRALEVKKYLMKILSIPAENIYAVGYADREPLKTSPNAVTEDPQRRAVLTLTTLP